ncbi:MAG: protein phosphatase 2C domain-containing protein, partial [Alphaproteobacteria bacterium]
CGCHEFIPVVRSVPRLKGAKRSESRVEIASPTGVVVSDAYPLGPTMLYRLNDNLIAAGATHRGRVRQLNEDAFAIDPGIGLLLVADGMGGHDAGDVASVKAVAAIREFLAGQTPFTDTTRTIGSSQRAQDWDAADRTLSEEDITSDLAETAGRATPSDAETAAAAVRHANDRLHAINRSRGFPPGKGMGTTIVGLMCGRQDSSSGTVVHVGDSRLYRLRDGHLHRLTRDHSAYQHWVDGGCEGAPPPTNIILQALGPRAEVTPSISTHTLLPGDIYLLCTDGLWGIIPDGSIEEQLHDVAPDSLNEACETLIRAANARGGNDNITVVLAAFLQEGNLERR